MVGSPSDPRQLSVRSSLSNIKTKLAEGRSSSSIDRGLYAKPLDSTPAFDDDEVERRSLLEMENKNDEQERDREGGTRTSNAEGQDSGATSNSDRTILLENSVT